MARQHAREAADSLGPEPIERISRDAVPLHQRETLPSGPSEQGPLDPAVVKVAPFLVLHLRARAGLVSPDALIERDLIGLRVEPCAHRIRLEILSAEPSFRTWHATFSTHECPHVLIAFADADGHPHIRLQHHERATKEPLVDVLDVCVCQRVLPSGVTKDSLVVYTQLAQVDQERSRILAPREARDVHHEVTTILSPTGSGTAWRRWAPRCPCSRAMGRSESRRASSAWLNLHGRSVHRLPRPVRRSWTTRARPAST